MRGTILGCGAARQFRYENEFLEGIMKIKGKVESFSVFGNGPNSAELQVRVRAKGGPVALRVGAYPATEPQVFAAICNVVTTAHAHDLKVEFKVEKVPKATPQILGVSLK